MTVALALFLIASVAFALWLRWHDRRTRALAALASLPPLIVEVVADLSKLTAAMEDVREAGKRWAAASIPQAELVPDVLLGRGELTR